MKRSFIFLPLAALCSAILFSAAWAQKDANKYPKLSVAEVIKKHIESIGTPQAIAAARSRVFVGSGHFSSKIGFTGELEGPVQMATSGDKVLLALIFNSPLYPYEKFGFDGKDVTVGIPEGITDVGAFVKANKGLMRHGFFGGALSSAWPLLEDPTDLKLEYGGLGEVNKRPAYKLRISTGMLGSASGTFYFDAETFRHVMSEYKYSESPRMGGQIIGASATPTLKSLTEVFGGFAKAGELVLPMTYKIEYTIIDGYGMTAETFTMKFNQAFFDQQLDNSVFKVS